MTKLLLSFLLATTSLFAQYTNNDYELVKTTFTREFNKATILPYLASNDNDKVIAALLSITHSKDTGYVPLITTLNNDRFGQHIAFAIGQLPFCNASIKYLSDNIYFSKTNKYSSDYLEAYGKVGGKKDYQKLVNLLAKSQSKHLDGFPYAIYNFHQRGIIENYQRAAEVLLADLYFKDEQIVFDALYGLARTDAGNYATKEISDFITSHHDSLSIRNLTYAISILRKSEDLTLEWTTIKELLLYNDWRVRSETVRALEKYNFDSANKFFTYIELIKDSNPNTARQVAMSLKSMKLNDEINSTLKENYMNLLENDKLTENVKGEFSISITALFPDESRNLIENLSNKISDRYLFSIIEQHNVDPEYAWTFLNSKMDKVNLSARMNLVSALLSYQDELKDNDEYITQILEELSGEEPTIISFMTFAMDSAFIHSNRQQIIDIIADQIESEIDNGEFSEALFSLHGIAKNIHPEFALEMLKKFKKSKCDDLVRYYKVETGEELLTRNPKRFDQLWEKAFEYSVAKIYTEKGSFTFNFRAFNAPISVGNFVYLSEKGFFDDVVFHRVVPNFVAQVGDPTGTGWGGPGYTINSELSPTPIIETHVGMASAGPDTEGSQWYIMHNEFPHLYGRYTMFGNVVAGMEVVNQLDQSSRIQKVELIK